MAAAMVTSSTSASCSQTALQAAVLEDLARGGLLAQQHATLAHAACKHKRSITVRCKMARQSYRQSGQLCKFLIECFALVVLRCMCGVLLLLLLLLLPQAIDMNDCDVYSYKSDGETDPFGASCRVLLLLCCG
jgi:hypothetical protein